MDWTILTNFLFNAFEKIVEMGNTLFTPITLQDAFIAIPKLFVSWFRPSFTNTMIDTIKGFFETQGWDFMNEISFTPIEIIGATGLIIVLVMGAIKLVSFFS